MTCSIFSLLIYVWYPSLYQDPKKRNPKVDFLVSTVLAMFWLAGAAAWANGLGGLKWSCDTSNWLDRVSVCTKTSNTHAHHQYLYPKVGSILPTTSWHWHSHINTMHHLCTD